MAPSIVGSSNSIRTEPPVPSLVTPAELLQSGRSVVASSKPLQTAHKDVEVVPVSSASPPEPSVSVAAESQPPILPLPVTSRPTRRPGGASSQTHGYGYRGRGRGRGIHGFRPAERFTEDFDFTAMNEKFKKDEVWGHLVPNKAPTASLPAVTLGANLSSLASFTNGGPDVSAAVSMANKPNAISAPSLSYQTVPQQMAPSIVGSSNSIRTEPPVPSLVTPAELLQSGRSVVASSKPLQTAHKDVEVVPVSSASPPEPSVSVAAESQPPILPLPVTSRPTRRPGGASSQTHGYGYRGRGRGRGIQGFRPAERFTEDFDFTAMNEKFKKDEV
ncbi:hypothetical protein RYX36_010793 [Vicia faba]